MPSHAALGADVDALERLAIAFDQAKANLLHLGARLNGLIRQSHWSGPSGTAFASQWESQHHRAIRAAATDCERRSRQLRRQVASQRTASGGSSHRARYQPLSRSESLVQLTSELRVGPMRIAPAIVARIEELDQQRSRVTVGDAISVGLMAGIGAIAEVGCGDTSATPLKNMSRHAETGANLGIEHRTIWEVPDDDVHGLLAAVAAERAAALIGLGPLGSMGRRLATPPPAGNELLVHATASAAAAVSVGPPLGPGVSVHTSVNVAVGAERIKGQRALVVEASDSTSAAVHLGILQRLGVKGPDTSSNLWARLEVPAAKGGGPLRVEIRSTSPSGTVDRIVVNATLRPEDATLAGATKLADSLQRGNQVSRASLDAMLAGLHHSATDVVVQTDRLTASTSGCSARAVGGMGATVGGGASARVTNLLPAP